MSAGRGRPRPAFAVSGMLEPSIPPRITASPPAGYPHHRSRSKGPTMSAARWILIALTSAALVVNAVIHLQLAGPFDAITGTLIGQGWLFRIQAIVNIAVAVLLLVVRRPWVAAAAAVAAAGGLALILITVAVPLDLTALGLPLLFEPLWYAQKTIAALVQGLAVLTGAILIGALRRTAAPEARRKL